MYIYIYVYIYIYYIHIIITNSHLGVGNRGLSPRYRTYHLETISINIEILYIIYN